MRTIGITGGIGAGKSAVLEYLKERYGAYIVVADLLAKELERPGCACYDALTEAFGEGILAADGEIDKQKLAALIFSDAAALARVNAILHPAVKTEILRQIAAQTAAGRALFVVEAALLIEEHYDVILDELWYVHATEEIRRERLKRTRGYTEEKIDSILSQQKTEAAFRAVCRYTIDNSGTMEQTRAQIDRILQSQAEVSAL